MSRLYRKSELVFALVMIGIYVLLLSLGDGLSAALGLERVVSAPLAVALGLVLFFWMRSSGLLERYGLARIRIEGRRYLYFAPLVLLVTANLWAGVILPPSAVQVLLHVVCMLAVGFVEEIIFRGLLFRAMERDGVRFAVFVSSITFGMGHAVNLLSGAPLVSTLLQMVYAAAIGFAFTVLFMKCRSLWPCIVTHGLFNALSIFSAPCSPVTDGIFALLLTVIPLAYALYLLRGDREKRPG